MPEHPITLSASLLNDFTEVIIPNNVEPLIPNNVEPLASRGKAVTLSLTPGKYSFATAEQESPLASVATARATDSPPYRREIRPPGVSFIEGLAG